MTELCKYNVIPYTLADGDYFIGVGALANSLYRSGYRGRFYVGYIGNLPEWTGGNKLIVSSDFEIHFIQIGIGKPLPFYKPTLGIEILEIYEKGCDGVIFLDADTLIVCDWPLLAHWVAGGGVACVIDHWHPRVPPGHPWREVWTQIAAEIAPQLRRISRYHITALVGVGSAHTQVLRMWQAAIDYVGSRETYGSLCFQERTRYEWPYLRGDQDFFAIAVMTVDSPLADMGPEALGFTGFPSMALHPFFHKPWRSGAWRNALDGKPPDIYERTFWKSLNAPIEVLPRSKRVLGLLQCRLRQLVGRFYRA